MPMPPQCRYATRAMPLAPISARRLSLPRMMMMGVQDIRHARLGRGMAPLSGFILIICRAARRIHADMAGRRSAFR